MKKLFSLLVVIGLCWGGAPHAQAPRAIYIVPFIGNGTDTDPFRPRCYGLADTNFVDLRPNPAQQAGFAICGSPTLPALTGLVQIGDLAGAFTTRKAAIETALGSITLKSTTVDGLLSELLIDLPLQRAVPWKPVRATRSGKLNIWLSGSHTQPAWTQTAFLYPHIRDHGIVADALNSPVLVAARIVDGIKWAYAKTLAPALAYATTLAVETFNCADNASPTCVFTWTEFQGTGAEIVSNQFAIRVTGQQESHLDSALATDNHAASITLKTLTETGGGFARFGPIVHKDSSGTRTFQWCYADFETSVTNYQTATRSGGTFSAVANAAQAPLVNDVVTCIIDGTDLYMQVNGLTVVGPSTNSIGDTNLYVGMASNANTSTFDARGDDFQGYDFPLAATTRPIAPFVFQ